MSIHKKLLGGAVTAVLALASLSVPTAVAAPAAIADDAGIHAVIPAVRHFNPSDGDAWKLSEDTKIVAPQSLEADAQKMAIDLALKGNIKPAVVVDGQPDADDIVLKVDSSLADIPRDDGYTIVSTKDLLTVTGKSVDGAFWGEQTVIQSVASAGGVQAGTVQDWADVPERSFHQDMARKYYSKAYLMNLVHQLSYLKINTLQLHFSENEGFRIESKTHPEIVSKDGFLTQDELAQVLAEAKKYHIEVVPALDMPGHMRHILNVHPELRLKLVGWDTSGEDMRGLDFSKPEAKQLVKELIDEYAPLFPDTNKWHLGADEFVNFRAANTKYPETTARIKAELGENARFVDGFVTFINDTAKYLKDTYHKDDVRVWNDAFYRTDAEQTVELSRDITIDYWTSWGIPMAPVQKFVDKGFKLINYNDGYLYFVLGEAAGYKYPTVKHIYAGGFHAGHFPKRWGSLGEQVFPQKAISFGKDMNYPQWLRGSSFAIWSDHANALTEDQVASMSKGPYTAFADRVWYAGDERNLDQFNAAMQAVGSAPDVPADLDQVVVGTKSELTSTLETASKAKPGDALALTAKVTNTSSKALPINAKVEATNVTATAGDVPVTVLDTEGNPAMMPGKNVALASEGATAEASSEEVAKFGAGKVIDGDASSADSRWSSAGGNQYNNESLTITLKEPTDLVKLRLAWEGAYASEYTVTYSHPEGADTEDHFTFTRAANKKPVWAEHDIAQKQVTKIKITGTKRSTEMYGISLFEVEAYGADTAVSVDPAKLDAAGNLTWNGTLEPNQSVKFNWDAVVAEGATGKATVKLTSEAKYALKSGEPSESAVEFMLPEKPKPADPKPADPKPAEPKPAEPGVSPSDKVTKLPDTGSSVLGLGLIAVLLIGAGVGVQSVRRRKM